MAEIENILGTNNGNNNITKTSQLINDGADGTSVYVEQDELSVTAFSNDYNDLDNLPDLSLKEDKSNKGIANGYGSLDINGKQPLSEVNDALIGNVHWKGIYNGTIITSSPDPSLIGTSLPSPASTNVGWYFIAQGSFTNAGINYETGDWIISDGSTWNKVDNTDAVFTVNSKVGNVVLNTDDILETGTPTNKWWTNARTIATTLTGYISGIGTISASDTILSAIQKLNGNITALITGVSSVFGRTGNVTAQTGDYTTDQVTEVTNKKYVTDAELIVLTNTSNTNTGDETTSTIKTKLGAANTSTDGYLISTDWNIFNNKQQDLKTFNKTKGIYYHEEFMGNQAGSVSTSYGQLISLNGGTGAVSTTASLIINRTNQQGVVQHNTGSTATGFSGWSYGAGLFIGRGTISIETYITVNTLSTSLERFFTVFGYGTPSNWASMTNAIFMTYDEGGGVYFANASPNWKCYTRAGGVTTVTISSVPVVAQQWYKLRIEINAAGTSVGFYVDNVLIATHTTNIPASNINMALISLMVKTVGTTARTAQSDYFNYEEIFTNPR